MASIRTLVNRLAPHAAIAAYARQAWSAAQRHDPLEQVDAECRLFRRTYPAYDTTSALDTLRATEYARIDREGHVYLDYTGGGLYAESQLREHMALLQGNVFGNPHSRNL